MNMKMHYMCVCVCVCVCVCEFICKNSIKTIMLFTLYWNFSNKIFI